MVANKQNPLLYSWKFFPNSARSHWLLWGQVTYNNETVSRQNLLAGNIAKSMTSEDNSALLPANVDRQPPLQRSLMSFQIIWRLVPRQKVNFAGNIEILGKQN